MFSFEDVYWKKRILYRFEVVVIATLTNRTEVYAKLNVVAKNIEQLNLKCAKEFHW